MNVFFFLCYIYIGRMNLLLNLIVHYQRFLWNKCTYVIGQAYVVQIIVLSTILQDLLVWSKGPLNILAFLHSDHGCRQDRMTHFPLVPCVKSLYKVSLGQGNPTQIIELTLHLLTSPPKKLLEIKPAASTEFRKHTFASREQKKKKKKKKARQIKEGADIMYAQSRKKVGDYFCTVNYGKNQSPKRRVSDLYTYTYSSTQLMCVVVSKIFKTY